MGLGGGTGIGASTASDKVELTVTQVMQLLLKDKATLQLADYAPLVPSPTVPAGRVTLPTRVLELRDVRVHKERFTVYCATRKMVLSRGRDTMEWEAHSYHVIRDGKLHIPCLLVQLQERDTFQTLQSAGLIALGSAFDTSQVYSLDLRGLPLLSRAMVDFEKHPIVSRLQQRETLERDIDALQKHAGTLPYVPYRSFEGAGSRRAGPPQETQVLKDASKELVTHVSLELVDFKPAPFDPKGFTTRPAVYSELDKARAELQRVQYLLRLQAYALLQFLPEDRWLDCKVKRRKEHRTLQVDGKCVLLRKWQRRV